MVVIREGYARGGGSHLHGAEAGAVWGGVGPREVFGAAGGGARRGGPLLHLQRARLRLHHAQVPGHTCTPAQAARRGGSNRKNSVGNDEQTMLRKRCTTVMYAINAIDRNEKHLTLHRPHWLKSGSGCNGDTRRCRRRTPRPSACGRVGRTGVPTCSAPLGGNERHCTERAKKKVLDAHGSVKTLQNIREFCCEGHAPGLQGNFEPSFRTTPRRRR